MMNIAVARRTFLFAACPVFVACGVNRTQHTSARSIAIDGRVDSLFRQLVKPDGPGCAVGIYKNGTVVLKRGYGLANIEDGRPLTPHTAFNLGSLSKPFTAFAVLMLEQQGKLSIEDDVRKWVPELPNYGKPIRVRDLLEHTSGLRDYQALEVLMGSSVQTMPEFLGLMTAQRALNFEPGARHEYSHSDYLVLALVVERVAGMPFGDFLERTVLEPIGMRDAFVSDDRVHTSRDRALAHVTSSQGARAQFPDSRTVGGVNLYASVTDFAQWDRNFDEPRIGAKSIIDRMITLPVLANGDTVPYAYGLRLGTYRGLRTIERRGNSGGTRTDIIRFPDQRVAIATLCNATHLDAEALAKEVAAMYLGDLMQPGAATARRPSRPAAVSLPVNELARYAGFYRSVSDSWNLLPIEIRDGELGDLAFDDARDDTLFVMTPTGDHRFFEIGLTGNIGIYQFKVPASGVPDTLEISWNNGSPEVFERIPDSTIWRPSATELTEYAGVWFSQELDTSWQFDVRNGRLFIRRLGKPDVSAWPVERDAFIRGFGRIETLLTQIQFYRDRAGNLTHLAVSTRPGENSVRNARFVRVSTR